MFIFDAIADLLVEILVSVLSCSDSFVALTNGERVVFPCLGLMSKRYCLLCEGGLSCKCTKQQCMAMLEANHSHWN